MKSRCAFTLIELLTVITVVSILAAILLVALSGARENTRKAESVSNIRQLYQANMSYLNDHGRFPDGNGWTWQGPESGTKTWHERVGQYLGLGQSHEQVLAQFRKGERPPSIFAVPERERILTVNGGEAGGYRSDYTRSMRIFVNETHMAQGLSHPNLFSFASLAETFFLMDAGGHSSDNDFNGWKSGSNRRVAFSRGRAGHDGWSDRHLLHGWSCRSQGQSEHAHGSFRCFLDSSLLIKSRD